MEIVKIDSEEIFHQTRKGRIGSSDIAAICGLNPWRTPLRVFLEMTGKVEPEPENEAMWLGKRLEPVVADAFYRRHPEFEMTDPKSMWVDDWRVASPDRLLNSNSILECKTSSYRLAKKWEESLPEYVQCQVQWQMGVTGFRDSFVAALIGGRDYMEYPVKADGEVYKQLNELGERFMARVQRDEPPEPNAEDSEIVKTLFEPDPKLEIELQDEANKKLEELAKLKDVIGPLEKEKKTIETWLRFAMGKASVGLGDNYILKISTVNKKAYEVKASSYTQMRVEKR